MIYRDNGMEVISKRRAPENISFIVILGVFIPPFILASNVLNIIWSGEFQEFRLIMNRIELTTNTITDNRRLIKGSK